MPTITGPDGQVLNVPKNINGRELRGTLNIPDNRILTKTDVNGKESIIKNSDKVEFNPGDKIDHVTGFRRGA